MNKITWKNETRKIADLKPAEYNPRQMTQEQARQLEQSLDLAASIVYLSGGDVRRCVYWFSAAVLTATVTF